MSATPNPNRREFRIAPLQPSRILYEPLVDRHLEYFFASKHTRQILQKTKVVNRRNEILDRSLTRELQRGALPLSNNFRLKKTAQGHSLSKHPQVLSKTVGKEEFAEFL
jgi:hypothetical protein